MIHAGVGVSQMNSILAALNIPAVQHKLINQRQTEVGQAVEKVANDSILDSLKDECNATERYAMISSLGIQWIKNYLWKCLSLGLNVIHEYNSYFLIHNLNYFLSKLEILWLYAYTLYIMWYHCTDLFSEKQDVGIFVCQWTLGGKREEVEEHMTVCRVHIWKTCKWGDNVFFFLS